MGRKDVSWRLKIKEMNDLSLHILDIVQNSISAGASMITIVVDENISGDKLLISVEDNGKGMSEEKVSKLSDPFFTSRTTRKVGLGIPLLKHSAMQSGGDVKITSQEGKGTLVEAWFLHSNIDRPPLGDVANAVILLVSANPDLDFKFIYKYNQEEYIFDTIEIKEVLEGVSLNNPSIIKYLTEMVNENIKLLRN